MATAWCVEEDAASSNRPPRRRFDLSMSRRTTRRPAATATATTLPEDHRQDADGLKPPPTLQQRLLLDGGDDDDEKPPPPQQQQVDQDSCSRRDRPSLKELIIHDAAVIVNGDATTESQTINGRAAAALGGAGRMVGVVRRYTVRIRSVVVKTKPSPAGELNLN